MAAISFPGKLVRYLFLPALSLLFLLVLSACTGTAAPPVTPVILPPGVDAGMNVTLEVSKPPKGTFLKTGDRATVTVTLKDNFGNPLTKDDFATLSLYMYGPQETTRTVTAVKLLNATTDRTKTPHHYIDLLTNANVQVTGNVLKYALQPVTNEEPGTYTASLRAVKKGDPPVNQAFMLTDFQLGTATVEKQIVEKEKCASCHRGAQSGQFYFAHVDPGRSPYGNPAIDSVPVRTCKSCHNNEGYAAYVSPADGTTRIPDQIVNRVHGVHMGEHLKNPLNTDPKTGVFKDYTGVLFPANVENCTTCHVDDRWKTQPSRLACGACHDDLNWATGKSVVEGRKAHGGGPQANDSACAGCHTPDTGGVKPISVSHKVTQPYDQVVLSMTAPRNGKFYVAGEKPVLTIVVKDSKGNPIDHTKVDNTNFSTAALFVYGPRRNSVPVLTSTAKNGNSKLRASLSNSLPADGSPTKGWIFLGGDTFKVAIHGNPPQELLAPVGLQTPDQVRDWLKANLKDVTVTSNNTAGTVTIRSNIQGANSKFEIYNSRVTAIMGWKQGGLPLARGGMTSGVTMEPLVVIGNASFPTNDLRKLSDPLDYSDPNVTRNTGNVTYQLDDVADMGKTALGLITFQVGTETPDPKVATDCKQCHGDTIWHLDEGPIHAEPFDPDYCKACHDYSRYATGNGFIRTGGTSTSGWSGYGAVPISRRVHMVHFGRYLEFPEELYAGNPNIFNEVIFPQDVRNCTKCHSADTTGTWKTEPSRLACISCHDSKSANAHAKLMTSNPTPTDEWNSNRVETCKICHGAGKEFSPDKVHNISKPYQPPYPREPD
ncbi:MAG: hypothetical protein HW414_1726 [Dehalococcoidia bacterium]|nr:hypothetical protein [Dehalococcoidia bacterium]